MSDSMRDSDKDVDIFHFKSGASTSGNVPPYECLTRRFLERCAKRMELGLHYGKHNWKRGSTDKEFILDRLNHAFVHLTKAMEAIDQDRVTEDDDLAAVAVNCMFAMEYQFYMFTAHISSEARQGHLGKEEERRMDLPGEGHTSPGRSSESRGLSPQSSRRG